MYEVELKVRANHDAVRERLTDLDAERRGATEQTDLYFDAPDRDFAATDEALRIRRERPESGSPTAHLTYKGPLVDPDSKTREERETVLTDADEMHAILDALGYEAAATVKKHRERFTVRGLTVALDDVADLGAFLEVESTAEDDIDAARDRARTLLSDLGLNAENQIRRSYLELLVEQDDSK
ncbi:MAG: class IV adenylate cyclase [Salinirussus sp.]